MPLPFARVVLAYGEPILIPPTLDRDALDLRRHEVEAAIQRVTRQVDERAGAV